MKRVAIVGADFTPSSLPPALRIRFFAQHLPEFGWEPIVVTTDPRYYESSVDPENEKLLPKSLEVIRTPAFPARWTRKIGVGDIGMRSLWHHWKMLVNLSRQKRVDLVFVPVPPFVPMILGRLIYGRFGVPYVIDYIDPWINEYYWGIPKKERPPKWALAYTMSRILEPFAIKHAAHVVGVSEGTTKNVISRYPWFAETDTTAIPYGGESSDFDYLIKNPRRNRVFDPDDNLLHFSYIGACIPPMYSTIRALFDAVLLGLKRSPGLFERLRMHFVGTSYAPKADGLFQVLPMAHEMGLKDFVHELPNRIPYLDSIKLMMDSHALVIVGSEAAHYTPSKVFPYILARRPLLALFHQDSSAVVVLKETRAGHVVTFSPHDPLKGKTEDISRRLEEILTLPREHRPATDWSAFEPYTTRSMAKRLAEAFDRAVDKRNPLTDR
jgi:hypothetical protein